MNQRTSFLTLLCLLLLIEVSAQKESDFYKETNHLGVSKNFVEDYGGNGSDKLDDSQVLKAAIDEIGQLSNGGKICFPAGTYYLGQIEMKSNVHLEFHKKAIIIPVEKEDDKNYAIFELGSRDRFIQNVSIRGERGSFVVDLRNVSNLNVTVFRVNAVRNFLISDVYVKDALTKFSAIATGHKEIEGKYIIPEKGVIKNAHIENAHYGYGLIQTQAGKDIFFNNISGKGGVTLRLETGNKKMNQLQVGGVFNLIARNVSCENGNAAVMISPHETKNGHMEVDGITAVSCGVGVRLAGGYISKKTKGRGLTPGKFANTSWVKNIKSTYGTNTQLKAKHFKYMPCNYRDEVTELVGYEEERVKIYTGPAIVAVLNETTGTDAGKYTIGVSNVTAIGYKFQKDIVYSKDAVDDCDD